MRFKRQVTLNHFLRILFCLASVLIGSSVIAKSIADTMIDDSRSKLIADIAVQHDATQRTILSESALVIHEKSVADGLVFNGNTSYNCENNNCVMRADRIDNNSNNRTTGTLRLELWATTNQPSRGGSLNGFILAVGSNLGQLGPRRSYTSVVSNGAQRSVTAGTYWVTLVLAEFDSSCTTSNDRFCVSDTVTFSTRQTFGGGSNPPATTGSPVFAGTTAYNCIQLQRLNLQPLG